MEWKSTDDDDDFRMGREQQRQVEKENECLWKHQLGRRERRKPTQTLSSLSKLSVNEMREPFTALSACVGSLFDWLRLQVSVAVVVNNDFSFLVWKRAERMEAKFITRNEELMESSEWRKRSLTHRYTGIRYIIFEKKRNCSPFPISGLFWKDRRGVHPTKNYSKRG